MSKSLSLICALFSALILTSGFAENDPLQPKEIELTLQTEKKTPRKSPSVKTTFSPFTGKVNGNKVRMRLQPDLTGYIVRELNKNALVSILSQEGDFYIIEPPEAIKAYIFRSFVLDGIVEGNRVNVRLEPDLEAPVIGHHSSGDQVKGTISSLNRKWLEIPTPATTRFYVAKEYIDFAGGPELKGKMDARKETVAQILADTSSLAKADMDKPFEEIDFDQIKKGYLSIINDYSDFPKQVHAAKEALVNVQELYLEKRIAYLEKKAGQVLIPANGQTRIATSLPTRLWNSIEDGLYASWARSNDEKEMAQFYEEQKMVATTVTGVLEAFKSPVKNKPGDYIIKNKNLPVAYVYSTNVDLSEYVGKKVSLLGSPRPNNSFAFPAYYVHEVQ